MLWRNTNECVVSENSCSKYFINFHEKHPSEIAFWNKVAGYLTLTGNVLLRNLWNFQKRFHKKHLQMPASAISCWRPFTMFISVCTWFVWFTSLCALFIWTSGNVKSTVSITHTVIFSKQEVSRRQVVPGSPGENKCLWNRGKKKQL